MAWAGGNGNLRHRSRQRFVPAPASVSAATRFAVNATSQATPSAAARAVVAVFLEHPAPTVGSVSPSSGPAAGGTAIAINARTSGRELRLPWGGAAANRGQFCQCDSAHAVTTGACGGRRDGAVTNPDGQAASLASGSPIRRRDCEQRDPASGSTSGGTAITINGNDLRFRRDSNRGRNSGQQGQCDQLRRKSRDHSCARGRCRHRLQVTNSNGQSATLAGAFTYATSLSITSVSRTSGGNRWWHNRNDYRCELPRQGPR